MVAELLEHPAARREHELLVVDEGLTRVFLSALTAGDMRGMPKIPPMAIRRATKPPRNAPATRR